MSAREFFHAGGLFRCFGWHVHTRNLAQKGDTSLAASLEWRQQGGAIYEAHLYLFTALSTAGGVGTRSERRWKPQGTRSLLLIYPGWATIKPCAKRSDPRPTSSESWMLLSSSKSR